MILLKTTNSNKSNISNSARSVSYFWQYFHLNKKTKKKNSKKEIEIINEQ